MMPRHRITLRRLNQRLAPGPAFRRQARKTSDDEVEMGILELLAPPGLAAFDLGANLGHYAARLAAVAPQVWAFESNPGLAPVLRAGVPTNLRVLASAFPSTDGYAIPRVPKSAEIRGLATLEGSVSFARTRERNKQRARLRRRTHGHGAR